MKGFLLPALALPSSRVITPERFRPGASILEEFTRAVTGSRFTVVVLSPAFFTDSWAELGQQLAAHLAVAERENRLLPVLLHPCQIPLDLKIRVHLDFTREEEWDAAADRLRREVSDQSYQPAPVPVRAPCPYPGMRPYTDADAEIFHGRDQEIRDLLWRLPDVGSVFVIGPSGSGKSSLVSAGLVPKLRRESDEWLVRVVRPGEQPMEELRSKLASPALDDVVAAVTSLLAGHPPARRLLLVVDQLEEVFVQASAAGRQEFLAAVQALRQSGRQGGNCVVVFTLRADFYPNLMLCRELWPVADAERLDLVPLRPAELHEAIERPALHRGVYLEPALVERLVADAAAEPGVLPLLQETLRRLWGEMHHRLLTTASYEALGRDTASGTVSGLARALADWADKSLDGLTSEQQDIAREVFLRLVHLGEGCDTRRQQPVMALQGVGGNPARLEEVLDHLVRRRLLYRWHEPDLSWVRGTLVPRLKAERFQVCIDHESFRIGASLVGEMTRAVEQSRYTLAVLSPAYLESGFTELENILAEHLGLELRQLRLLAVLREACRPRLGIRARLLLDMTDDAVFEDRFARLAAALRPS